MKMGAGDSVSRLHENEVRIKGILEEAKSQVKVECREQIFEGNKKLSSEDLKTPQDPEEFTKRYIIEKVFQIFKVSYETGERRFKTIEGTRKVDYGPKFKETNFLLEAKPINDDLYKKSPDGAVNQIKGLFRLVDVKENYEFGIATDGLKWVFINPKEEIVGEFTLEDNFPKIRDFITGKKKVREEKKEEEISKRFYEWYNALLHGGSFRDQKSKLRTISTKDCLVNNILNVTSEEAREEIAQVIIGRLIFIKFLQTKGLIKSDILEYLASLSQDALNWKLNNLFFNVLNTEKEKRSDTDPKFADIPYLNGSLFTKTRPEERNQYYAVKAEILQKVIEFLDSFRFVSELEIEEEALDPEILGYIFERAMTAIDRKGTGAYYTPRYITRYISENTVYPFVLERSRIFLKEKKGYGESELPRTIDELIRKVSATTLSDIYADIVQKVRVLDPACGSGAFLLSAADTLLELYYRFEERLGLRNSPVALKKVILKNSIFGVDINHKGIEIAKLRLWLWIADSYDPEKEIEPLPNIEYNIRAGNSLIGFLDISKFKEAMVSLDDYLGGEESLTELLKERDSLIDEYKAAYGEKARELRKKIEGFNEKVKRLLDVRLFQELQKKVGITPEQYAKLEPFHWGFEFHEVFANERIGNGFDVVIGNPPYVRQEALGDLKKILKEYYEVYHGVADLYTYFFERGHKVLRQGGQFGFISSNKFLRGGYGGALRKFLSDIAHVKKITDFGDLPVFEDATTYPAIFLTMKTREKGPTIYTKIPNLDFTSLQEAIKKHGFEIPQEFIIGTNWKLRSPLVNQLLKKIEKVSVPLREYSHKEIYRGVTTGYNNAFIIDENTKNKIIKEDPSSREIIKPFLRGKDIQKWYVKNPQLYLIFTRRGINIDDYPGVKKHLEQFKELLIPKPENWDDKKNGKWKGRKPGKYKWYEIQDSTAYWKEFENEKIIVPGLMVKSCYAYDLHNSYVNAPANIIPVGDKYLLGLLNSKLLWFYFCNSTISVQADYLRIYVRELEKLPIIQASKEVKTEIISLVEKIENKVKEEILTLEKELDQIVYKLYGLTEDEIKIVEGAA